MRCSVALVAETRNADLSPELTEYLMDHFAAVMDALVELEECDARLSNADMSVCLGEHRATFSIDVEGQSIDASVDVARGAMRTAIHKAGGQTPGWEKHRWSVVLEEEDDDMLTSA